MSDRNIDLKTVTKSQVERKRNNPTYKSVLRLGGFDHGRWVWIQNG